MARMRIGDMLVKAGLIDEMQLATALAHQRQWGGKLGDILVDRGHLDEQMLWLGLSRQLGVPLVSLPTLTLQPDVLSLVPAEMCERLEIFPLTRDDRTITIATSDPNNVGALDEVAFRVGLKVKTVLAPAREVSWAQRYYYRGDRSPCPPPRQRRATAPDTPQVARPTTTPDTSLPPSPLQQASTPPQPNAAPSAQMPWPNLSQPPMALPTAPSAMSSNTSTWQAPNLNAVPNPGTGPWTASAMPSAEEQLRQANEMLTALVELCIQRGVFTREELWHRLTGGR